MRMSLLHKIFFWFLKSLENDSFCERGVECKDLTGVYRKLQESTGIYRKPQEIEGNERKCVRELGSMRGWPQEGAFAFQRL